MQAIGHSMGRGATAAAMALMLLVGGGAALGESCTTQSAMTATVRDALAAAGRGLAEKVQAGDASAVRAMTVPEYAKDFRAIENAVAATSAKVKDARLVVEQVYLLEASDLKLGADGSAPEAQFLCSLNQTIAEAEFTIPTLPPGRYGFAIVEAHGATPWRLSFLMRQEEGPWLMTGFYPKPMTAAGHDGLWYWTQARVMAKDKERWNAWLYYLQAESLLNPANFIQSSHLEKLKLEESAATPPAASEGVSATAPLVVRGTDGAEYHFTGIGTDDSLAKDKLDVAARLKVDAIGDPAAARKRNESAMAALLAAYPEMRKGFHGVWIFAEAPGQNPLATEHAMNEIP
ncbi:hypothetical protein [Edaphobacter bradus]|uniref:hypothetical protein n=1 Tax=Edaphobacter bradus TaxID=2259016 RepID=UPI0021E0C760|nr:hypothetical protein [Edaphobacter bradus]